MQSSVGPNEVIAARLPRAGHPRDQLMTAHHRQRQPDLDVRVSVPVGHGRAEFERRSGESLTGSDLVQGILRSTRRRDLSGARALGCDNSRATGRSIGPVIFKAVGEGRPYPDHGLETPAQWSTVSPRAVCLEHLITTKRTLDLAFVLSTDSTFYGDIFARVVSWRDEFYLKDGLHRALRAALQPRSRLHARVLTL